jgi:hypothetical protein
MLDVMVSDFDVLVEGKRLHDLHGVNNLSSPPRPFRLKQLIPAR